MGRRAKRPLADDPAKWLADAAAGDAPPPEADVITIEGKAPEIVAVIDEPHLTPEQQEQRQRPSPVRTVAFQSIALAMLVPSAGNPASRIDPSDPALRELAESLKSLGQQQPIVARPITSPDTIAIMGGATFEILAGHRRYAAAKLAGLESLEARVVDCDDRGAAAVRVVENLQRKDLSALEQAADVASLIALGWDHGTIAKQLGRSASWVHLRARISTDLIPEIRERLTSDPRFAQVSAAHLELVARLPEDAQRAAAAEIDDKLIAYDGQIESVDEWRSLLSRFHRRLADAPWKLDDAQLVPAAGACSVCPKRTACQQSLFPDLEHGRKDDRCLDAACFAAKGKALIAQRVAEAKETHGEEVVIFDPHRDSGVKGALNYGTVQGVVKTSPPRGYVPAVAVSGQDAGQVIYVKPAPKPQAERPSKEDQAKVQAKQARQKRVINAISEAAEGASKKWTAEQVLRLLAACHGDATNLAVASDVWLAVGDRKRTAARDLADLRELIATEIGDLWSGLSEPALRAACDLVGIDFDAVSAEPDAGEKLPGASGTATSGRKASGKGGAVRRVVKSAKGKA
jgi:ParB/RepB/Spo0J family partition protein